MKKVRRYQVLSKIKENTWKIFPPKIKIVEYVWFFRFS
jgi:hypothetical protein